MPTIQPTANYALGDIVTATDMDGKTVRVVQPGVSLKDATGANASFGGVPSSSASAANAPVKTAVAAGSLIAKASAGNLYGYNCANGASAGYLMIFDSATVPADGTVTPLRVYVMAANSSVAEDLSTPIRFSNGLVLVFSTTGPFTKTISATAFLEAEVA